MSFFVSKRKFEDLKNRVNFLESTLGGVISLERKKKGREDIKKRVGRGEKVPLMRDDMCHLLEDLGYGKDAIEKVKEGYRKEQEVVDQKYWDWHCGCCFVGATGSYKADGQGGVVFLEETGQEIRL